MRRAVKETVEVQRRARRLLHRWAAGGRIERVAGGIGTRG
jgi:hypothetical protein